MLKLKKIIQKNKHVKFRITFQNSIILFKTGLFVKLSIEEAVQILKI